VLCWEGGDLLGSGYLIMPWKAVVAYLHSFSLNNIEADIISGVILKRLSFWCECL
jgi:hypothetical protein